MGSVEREARHVEVLASLSSAIAHSSDLDSVLEAVLAAALDALDLEAGGVFLLHEETGELRATTHYRGVPAEYVEAISRFRRGEGYVGKALESQKPVIVPDLTTAEESREATRRLGLRTMVFVPL